jgi:flagellar biosynthesis/type III secretory pathway M-ring protein FliF/YscJ
MLNDVFMWIIGLIVAVLGGGLLFEKRKATKATKAKEKAEEERDKLKIVTDVQKEADKIKDDLAKKAKENQQAKEEVIHDLEEIPEEKEVELSEDIKKLAADQSTRARDRAKRLQNDLGPTKR